MIYAHISTIHNWSYTSGQRATSLKEGPKHIEFTGWQQSAALPHPGPTQTCPPYRGQTSSPVTSDCIDDVMMAGRDVMMVEPYVYRTWIPRHGRCPRYCVGSIRIRLGLATGQLIDMAGAYYLMQNTLKQKLFPAEDAPNETAWNI